MSHASAGQQSSSLDLDCLADFWGLLAAWLGLCGLGWPCSHLGSWLESMGIMWPQVSPHMVAWACSHGRGQRAPKSVKKERLQCATTFQTSACITFANVLLANASHMAKP